MDDLLKRIGALESGVSDIRAQVSAVTAVLPHLATKADLTREVGGLIKWIVGTAIASVAAASGIAAAIARFVH